MYSTSWARGVLSIRIPNEIQGIAETAYQDGAMRLSRLDTGDDGQLPMAQQDRRAPPIFTAR